MKTGQRNRKYLYIEVMTALLIVFACALFKYTTAVQKIAAKQ